MRYSISKYPSVEHLDPSKTWLMLETKTNRQLAKIYPIIRRYSVFIPMMKSSKRRNNDKVIKYSAVLPDYIFIGFDKDYTREAILLEEQIQVRHPYISFLREFGEFKVADKEFLSMIERGMTHNKRKIDMKYYKQGDSFLITNGYLSGKTAKVLKSGDDYIDISTHDGITELHIRIFDLGGYVY